MNQLSMFLLASPALVLLASLVPAQEPTPDTPATTVALPATPAPSPLQWDLTDRKAHSFSLAKQGRFGEALEVADALLASEDLGHRAGGVGRFRARVLELQDLRMEYLTSLQQQGTRLKFERDGRKVSAPVLGVSETTIQFKSNKRVPAVLPIEALSMADLAKLTRRLDPLLGSPGSRALLDVLGGDDNWKKRLDRELEAGLEREVLYADHQDAIALFEHGMIVGKMETLISDLEGEAQLAALGELMATHGAHALVQDRLALLRSLFHSQLMGDFTTEDTRKALSATKVTITGDVIRMVYNFASEDDLVDFVNCEETLSLSLMNSTPVVQPKGKWHSTARGSGWNLRGSYNFRHVLTLRAPVFLEMNSLTRALPGGEVNGVTTSFLGTLCDDLSDTYVLTSMYGFFLGHSVGGDFSKSTFPESRLTPLNTLYRTALSLADGVARTYFEGEERLKLEGCQADQGHIQLAFRANHVMEIKSLLIEGTMTDATRLELASLYADRQLRRVGL